jgi:hypothetical protein
MTKVTEQIQFTSIGVDIGKDVFHIVGFDNFGTIHSPIR